MKRSIVVRQPSLIVDLLPKISNCTITREFDDRGELFVVTLSDEVSSEREEEVRKEIMRWEEENRRINQTSELKRGIFN